MTWRARRTVAAGFATATALAALFPVFQGGAWFWRVFGAILVVVLTGLLTRRLGLPRVLQPLASLLILAGYLVLLFAPGTLHYGLPSADTWKVLSALVEAGQADIERYSPPVAPRQGVVLLAAAGVGLVAVLVDAIAVLLDRVAVAGLPLLALFAVPSAVLPGGLGGLPFAIGAIGWLMLLVTEGNERVDQWGRPLRSTGSSGRPGDDSSIGRVGRRIGAAALGLAVVVPALVPGLDHRLVGGSGGGSGEGDGNGPSSATTYNPVTTLRDQLTLPTPRQLFVYTSDDPTPDYLRMTTLDIYTGEGWASSKLEADRDKARVQNGIGPGVGERSDARHRKVTMRLAVDTNHLEVHWLPLPYGPRTVKVEGNWLWDRHSQTVFSASRTTSRLRPYTVEASRLLAEREDLLGATNAGLPPDIRSRYGGAFGISPLVAQTVEQETRGATTPYEKAVALQSFFTNADNGFVYDFNASLPTLGQDSLEAFLTGKHGFCEQYATAMAVMLRTAGIPSRVAVGFTPGHPVPGKAKTYSVTTSDAHAWPEAWFEGSGWVRFEPTPAAGASLPDYSVPSSTSPGVDPTPAPRPTPSTNAFPRGFEDPDVLLRTPTTTPGNALVPGGHRGLWTLVGMGVLLLSAAPWSVTRWRRRARAKHMDAQLAWCQLRDDMTDVGLGWNPALSPRATIELLRPHVPQQAHDALARLAHATELARYAPAGRTSASAASLVADGAVVRRALLSAASRPTRWRATVFPASTLRWATHTASEKLADVLDVTDRAFAWLGRPFRRLLRA